MTEAPVKGLLRRLGAESVPPPDARQRLGQRARIVQHVERLDSQLLHRDATRARRFRVLLAVTAAAACVLVGMGLRVGWLEPHDASVHVSVVDGTVNVDEDRQGVHRDVELSRNDSVKTPELANARLALDSGAQVQLAAASEARFGQDGLREQVTLLRGSVAVRVPKLSDGASLGVKTFDTEVEVHGTQFTVSIEGAQQHRWTKVEVREGIVSVKSGQHELFLTAPSRWVSSSVQDEASPAEPRESAVSAPANEAERAAAPPRKPSTHAAPEQPNEARLDAPTARAKATPKRPDSSMPSDVAAGPAAKEASKVSTLAEQNELFAEAKDALRGANPSRGIVLMERFVQRYPGSLHAESALVERMRALSQLGRQQEAARSAQRYLANYPNGFAREEAQRLALGASQ